MTIPKQALFFWGRQTAFPYVRYLTLATFRILHPDWPMFMYRCTCNLSDKWGAIFQDFQFDADELNKIYSALAARNYVVPEETRKMIYDTLLDGKEPSPWDRISYDCKKIEASLFDNQNDLEAMKTALMTIVQTRKDREAKRPIKHDYIQDCVERLGVELREYEPKDERTYTMPPPNVSDIFSVEMLDNLGGWYFDCDQVITQSFDAMSGGYDFCAGGQEAFYIGIFGSKQHGKVVKDFYNKMLNGYSPEFYNSTGISAIVHGCLNDRDWLNWFKGNKEINHILPQPLFYPLGAWNGARRFWNIGCTKGEQYDITRSSESMAVHYYGGNAISQKFFREMTPQNVLTHSDNNMTRWIKKISNNGQDLKKELCFD